MMRLPQLFRSRITGPACPDARMSLAIRQRLDFLLDLAPKEEPPLKFTPAETLESTVAPPNSPPFPTVMAQLSPASNVILRSDPRTVAADRFRLLQLRLEGMQTTKGIKRLLITSPLPEEGKSTVALNLATQLSQQGQRPVLLVEADVLRPSLCKKLGLDPWRGLTDCYRNRVDPKTAVRRIEIGRA